MDLDEDASDRNEDSQMGRTSDSNNMPTSNVFPHVLLFTFFPLRYFLTAVACMLIIKYSICHNLRSFQLC